jgi:hypothetical protein
MTLISTHALVEIDPESKAIRSIQGTMRIFAQIETKGYAVAMDKATREEVIIVVGGNRLEVATAIPQSINQSTRYEILARLSGVQNSTTGKEAIIIKKGNRLESITEIPCDSAAGRQSRRRLLEELRLTTVRDVTKLEADDLIEQQWAEIERLRTEIIKGSSLI